MMDDMAYPSDDRRYLSVLTIAGSDPSGGAGLQADLKTFSSLQCYGMSVVTALTAQNTQGVQSVHSIPASFIKEQLESIFNDIHQIDAIKIGMLGKHETIDQVASFLKKQSSLPPIIVDPVMFAKSGDQLIEDQAIVHLKEEILPLATIITPNLHEARQLLAHSVADKLDDMAFQLLELGPQAVVVKGQDGRDCLAMRNHQEAIWIGDVTDWVTTKNVHGSGCTFAAAITSFLARGESILTAVRKAKTYITKAIDEGARFELGHGCGPVYHHPYLKGTFIQECWFSIQDLYRRIQELPFLLQLAAGTLPWERFEFFIRQDYFFLLERAQTCANLASDARHERLKTLFRSLEENSSKAAQEIFDKYLVKQPAELWQKSPVCASYTDYLHQMSKTSTLCGLVTLVPCTLIYQKIGEHLKKRLGTSSNSNTSYLLWIETYSSVERRERVEKILSLVNRAVMICSTQEILQLQTIFQRAAQYEYELWEEAGQCVY